MGWIMPTCPPRAYFSSPNPFFHATRASNLSVRLCNKGVLVLRCYKLMYHSNACLPVFSPDHLALIRTASAVNKQLAVTGFLVREDDVFLQVLEGAKADVMGLYDRIRKDRRHRNVVTLYQGYERGRDFPDWDMGYTTGNGFCDLIRSSDDFSVVKDEVMARIVKLAEGYAAKIRAPPTKDCCTRSLVFCPHWVYAAPVCGRMPLRTPPHLQ